MTVAGNEQNELCARQVEIIVFIHAFNGVMNHVLVQEETPFHRLGLFERFEVLGKLSEALFKEAGQPAVHAALLVDF